MEVYDDCVGTIGNYCIPEYLAVSSAKLSFFKAAGLRTTGNLEREKHPPYRADREAKEIPWSRHDIADAI